MQDYWKLGFSEFLSNPPANLSAKNSPLMMPFGANQMIRDLGMPNSCTEDPNKRDEFLTELETKYDFVMIMEYMDESLILLRHLLGLDLLDILSLPANQLRENAPDPIGNLSDHQIANLKLVNAADHALYERFSKLFMKRLLDFGTERMATELDAYQCLNKAVYDSCRVASYPASELPMMYRPYGDSVGFFPAVESTMSRDLLWLCPRIAFSEVPYIDQLRTKQRYVASNSDRNAC